MTVHHGDYYQGKKNAGSIAPPAETDSPVPVPFASVTGKFLVVVEGPVDWCHAALAILKRGLRELGLGAKTNAGYGRMDLDYISREEAEEAMRQEAERALARLRQQQAEAEASIASVLRGLSPGNAEAQVTSLLQRLPGPVRQSFALQAITKLSERWLRDKGREQKAWVIALREAAKGTA